MNITANLSVWTAFAFTIMVLSGLYRENPVYKFAESVFIGVSAGYFALVWFFSIIIPSFNDAVNGEYVLLIPLIAGLLQFMPEKRDKRYSGLVLLPSMLIILFYLAASVPVYLKSYIVDIVRSSVNPLIIFSKKGNINWILTLNALISLVGTVSVIVFLISRKMAVKGPFYLAGQTGRFYLLIAIGVSFGYTLVSRIVLLIGRFDFIVNDFLGIRF